MKRASIASHRSAAPPVREHQSGCPSIHNSWNRPRNLCAAQGRIGRWLESVHCDRSKKRADRVCKGTCNGRREHFKCDGASQALVGSMEYPPII
eukprot:scaffold208515_cov30-Tisochrysis_lutea.AAC.1